MLTPVAAFHWHARPILSDPLIQLTQMCQITAEKHPKTTLHPFLMCFLGTFQQVLEECASVNNHA